MLKKTNLRWLELLLTISLLIITTATPACKAENRQQNKSASQPQTTPKTTPPKAKKKDKQTTQKAKKTAKKDKKTAKKDKKTTKKTNKVAQKTSRPSKTFSSGLPKNTKFEDLSNTQKLQFMTRVFRHETPDTPRAQLAHTACTTIAIREGREQNPETDKQLQQLCITSRDLCIQRIELAKNDEAEITMKHVEQFPKQCPATVKTAEKCIDAQHQQRAIDAKKNPTCEKITRASLKNQKKETLEDQIAKLRMITPGCEPLHDVCPGLLTLDMAKLGY